MAPSTDSTSRTIWDDKTRSDLLVEVLAVISPSSDQWEKIIERIHGRGYHYTSYAVT